jgi:hypothetical protein
VKEWGVGIGVVEREAMEDRASWWKGRVVRSMEEWAALERILDRRGVVGGEVDIVVVIRRKGQRVRVCSCVVLDFWHVPCAQRIQILPKM